MLYFIPAWYKENDWCENEQSWYVRRMHTEFDDTVKQIQLFQRNGNYPYEILLLSFTPNFRHFLHRQSVYHAPYWSCFDSIQEVERRKVSTFSFHDLRWPEGIEFIYTPFVVVALLDREKYAQVDFGEDGNLIRVDLFERGRHVRRNIYDDRGFLSCTIVYEEQMPSYQDYLMENGVWKARMFFRDGHVEINKNCPYYRVKTRKVCERRGFQRLQYDSMDQVIQEVLTAHLRLSDPKDIFCVAMHQLHTPMLTEALKRHKKLLSFFEDRYDLERHPEGVELIEDADYLITDSSENTQWLERLLGDRRKNLMEITPYDTRWDEGISQQLSEQKILVPVDGLEKEIFERTVMELAEYMMENEDARVCLFTRQAEHDRPRRILQEVQTLLKDAGLSESLANEETEKGFAENDLEEDQEQGRFLVEQCVDELSVSKCMKEQRLVVDLREIPELYLQILAVSLGTPQIVRKETKFMIREGNGKLLQDMDDLKSLTRFYLESLSNWNEARICAYELSRKYTTGVLLEKWGKVIEAIE